ncbi:NOC3p-domain-containing protein [Ceraceosorus guamensis]|uniref:NOC3p-domain-containing protein n=1 Tax=Ceraceosorus guamensis TaxID=1522189 RepID=A0A316VN01_9BASI|nr:NOC3p-domain-containing protein [Ceraceosorus guamensis]PWN38937.1 NOC3p-domain-containing protein [Ceraceosorus guamensis]
MPGKRPYQGPPSKARNPSGTTSGKNASDKVIKKQKRGPRAYIDLPQASKQPARAWISSEQEDNSGDEDLQAALGAEEMAGEGIDSDGDGKEGISPESHAMHLAENGLSSKGKGKASNGLDFLLNLDAKGISKSRAELARLKKRERALERAKTANQSREGRSTSVGSSSSSASTDMQGLSDDSDAQKSVLSEFSDTDSQLSDEDREMDVEAEHAARIKEVQARKDRVEARQSAAAAERKLPVRSMRGWASASDSESGLSDRDNGFSGARDADKSQQKPSRAVHDRLPEDEETARESTDDEEQQKAARRAASRVSTITSSARFGMLAPYEIMGLKKRGDRTQAAREQIAKLATDVVADPEMSLGLLRRLAVFANRSIPPPPDADITNTDGKRFVDDAIRGAAIMSMCAVFTDILPGYRIRPLSEAERREKTNQETTRRREFEQGLVDVYRQYLETCDKVINARIALSELALQAMCVLLTRTTHFNYRTNLVRALVSQLSRHGWSKSSEISALALIEVLSKDLSGEISLEVVRLLNRMIKERTYRVNARVLDLLLHLRLRDELGNTRADTQRASKGENADKRKAGKDKAKPKEVRKGKGQHLSKKQVKEMRERAEIDEEMKEANAEVDLEEREKNQTETLKLLFVLYFSILKAPSVPGPLLASSLEGLSRFAHRVNVDFFRDLLAVLRAHVVEARQHAESDLLPRHPLNVEEEENGPDADSAKYDTAEGSEMLRDDQAWGAGAVKSRSARRDGAREALHCLVTAYELLSGQGEALNIELSDMAGHLYAIMLPLALSPTIEDPPVLLSSGTSSEALLAGGISGKHNGPHMHSHLLRTDADILIRALELALLRPRIATFSSEVNAAFVKRMLACAIHLPPATACRLLVVAKNCIARDEKLEALLDTNDRAKNGKFDGESDNIDAARPLAAGEAAWELHLLIHSSNADVAAEAMKLANLQR